MNEHCRALTCMNVLPWNCVRRFDKEHFLQSLPQLCVRPSSVYFFNILYVSTCYTLREHNSRVLCHFCTVLMIFPGWKIALPLKHPPVITAERRVSQKVSRQNGLWCVPHCYSWGGSIRHVVFHKRYPINNNPIFATGFITQTDGTRSEQVSLLIGGNVENQQKKTGRIPCGRNRRLRFRVNQFPSNAIHRLIISILVNLAIVLISRTVIASTLGVTRINSRHSGNFHLNVGQKLKTFEVIFTVGLYRNLFLVLFSVLVIFYQFEHKWLKSALELATGIDDCCTL